jgi:hypothetical protein
MAFLDGTTIRAHQKAAGAAKKGHWWRIRSPVAGPATWVIRVWVPIDTPGPDVRLEAVQGSRVSFRSFS